MTALANHFSFEFKTGLRNPSALMLNYLFPLGFYAMMGLVMAQINPGFRDYHGAGYGDLRRHDRLRTRAAKPAGRGA